MSILAKAAMVLGAVLILLSYFHSYFALPWVDRHGLGHKLAPIHGTGSANRLTKTGSIRLNFWGAAMSPKPLEPGTILWKLKAWRCVYTATTIRSRLGLSPPDGPHAFQTRRHPRPSWALVSDDARRVESNASPKCLHNSG
jgi:hypothetical protein